MSFGISTKLVTNLFLVTSSEQLIIIPQKFSQAKSYSQNNFLTEGNNCESAE